MPLHRSFQVGLPDGALERALADFRPDVVHLASPIALGAVGLRAARRLAVPTVAVYQTDIGGFARQYGVRADEAVRRWVGRIHRRADRTLVPSRASWGQLAGLGVTDIHLWRRGVDLDLFGPQHRVPELNARWTRREPGSVVVGYVGRMAPEKQVRRLRELVDLPGTRLVVVGDGPSRTGLERLLPTAAFTGMLRGPELASVFASLDVFVHTGESETYCQTVPEAQASGVSVVAPAAGGPLDLVEHGRTGLLYDPADAHSLCAAVGRLAHDEDLRRSLATAGLTAVADRSWSTVVDQLIDVHYPAVLERGAPALAG